MASDPENEIQEQMRDWMEAAQRPEPPLTNRELKSVRELLDERSKTKWLRKQALVLLPVISAIVAAIAAGWKWLASILSGHP
jgi:aminoglycoside phosphotransferase